MTMIKALFCIVRRLTVRDDMAFGVTHSPTIPFDNVYNK